MDEAKRECLLFLMLPRDELIQVYIYIQRLISFRGPSTGAQSHPFPEIVKVARSYVH